MFYRESLNEISARAHDNAVAKGFYEDIEALCGNLAYNEMLSLREVAKRDFVLAQLALVDSEIGETVQAIRRKGIHHDDVAEELADIIIRVCDLAGYLDINLGRAVYQKMKINESRPRKHGKLC